MTRPIAPMLLVAAMAALWPAWAGAQTPAVVDSSSNSTAERRAPTNVNLRNYTIRNVSGKTIAEASVRLEGTSTDTTVTKTSLASLHAQAFAVTEKGCLDSVHVRFEDGKTLDARGLNACADQTVVVTADKITAETSATQTPGQPGTPSR